MMDYQKAAESTAKDAERAYSNGTQGKGLAAIAYALLHLADVIEESRVVGGGDR